MDVPSRRRLVFTDPESTMAGFSVTYDNVQFQANTKHQSIERKKGFHMYTMMYAARDRVIPRSLSTPALSPVSPLELPAESFIPTMDDFQCLRDRMCVIVERILVDFVPGLEGTGVVRHVPHDQS